ncbi:MAG: radical SAM protein [Candidatus Thermoplasmatota archaeon]|nr:radical SAM protein [Candidatus Thermoplasmatota archaeon]
MRYVPEVAVWETTLKCNLRCTHCGSAAGDARINELSTKECFTVIEQLSELGCQDVSLMGGEPLVRKDWKALGGAVKDLGMDLCMVTNGILVPDNIDALEALKPKVVGVSIDGLKDTHESIRGKGTFDRTMKAVDLLIDRNIQTTLITTVSKTNFNDLPPLADLIKGKGCNWQIQVAMPFGNFSRDLLVSEEDFYAAAMFIAKQRIENRFEDMPVIGAHCFGYHSKVLPGCRWSGCTAGITSMGLTSDGGVVGCLSMGNDRFIEGNIRDRSLREIWEDPDAFAYNRKFTKKDLGPNCSGCRYGKRCKGGCNSVSMSLTGRFHNDPYCFRRIERQLLNI